MKYQIAFIAVFAFCAALIVNGSLLRDNRNKIPAKTSQVVNCDLVMDLGSSGNKLYLHKGGEKINKKGLKNQILYQDLFKKDKKKEVETEIASYGKFVRDNGCTNTKIYCGATAGMRGLEAPPQDKQSDYYTFFNAKLQAAVPGANIIFPCKTLPGYQEGMLEFSALTNSASKGKVNPQHMMLFSMGGASAQVVFSHPTKKFIDDHCTMRESHKYTTDLADLVGGSKDTKVYICSFSILWGAQNGSKFCGNFKGEDMLTKKCKQDFGGKQKDGTYDLTGSQATCLNHQRECVNSLLDQGIGPDTARRESLEQSLPDLEDIFADYKTEAKNNIVFMTNWAKCIWDYSKVQQGKNYMSPILASTFHWNSNPAPEAFCTAGPSYTYSLLSGVHGFNLGKYIFDATYNVVFVTDDLDRGADIKHSSSHYSRFKKHNKMTAFAQGIALKKFYEDK